MLSQGRTALSLSTTMLSPLSTAMGLSAAHRTQSQSEYKEGQSISNPGTDRFDAIDKNIWTRCARVSEWEYVWFF